MGFVRLLFARVRMFARSGFCFQIDNPVRRQLVRLKANDYFFFPRARVCDGAIFARAGNKEDARRRRFFPTPEPQSLVKKRAPRCECAAVIPLLTL